MTTHTEKQKTKLQKKFLTMQNMDTFLLYHLTEDRTIN